MAESNEKARAVPIPVRPLLSRSMNFSQLVNLLAPPLLHLWNGTPQAYHGNKSDYTEKAHPILELYSLLSEKSEHFLFAKNQAGEKKMRF